MWEENYHLGAAGIDPARVKGVFYSLIHPSAYANRLLGEHLAEHVGRRMDDVSATGPAAGLSRLADKK